MPVLKERSMVNPQKGGCDISKALNVIGGKWSFLVIKQLLCGDTKRFAEIKRGIAGVTPKSLTDTLRHLEEHAIINRKVYPTVPVTVEYTLTEKGKALKFMINEMSRWSNEWA